MNNYLFVIPSYNGGGAEMVNIKLANYLAENNNIFLFVINPKGHHKGRINKSVKLFESKRRKTLFASIELVELIKKYRIDSVMATLPFPIILIGLLKKIGFIKCRVIARLGNQLTKEMEMISNNLIKRIYKYSIKCFDGVICQNKLIKDQIELLGKIETKTIYNPIIALENLNKKNTRKGFMWVGRISTQKNIKILLKINALLPEPIYVYTKQEEIADLKKQFSEVNKMNIIVNEFTEDIVLKMAESKALIITSIFEGLPNVALEALSVGTPVLTTHYEGGGHELFNKSNSIYFSNELELENILNNFDKYEFKFSNIITDIMTICDISLISKEYKEFLSNRGKNV